MISVYPRFHLEIFTGGARTAISLFIGINFKFPEGEQMPPTP